MYSSLANPYNEHPCAYFIDETSEKLIVAGNLPDQMIDDVKIADKFHRYIAKFVELCDVGQ